MDQASKMLQRARRMPIPDVSYSDLSPVNSKGRRRLIRDHKKLQAALDYWEALDKELHDAGRDDGFVQQEVDSVVSRLIDKVRYCEDEARQAARDEEAAQRDAETLRKAGLRPIRMASIAAIYNAAKRSYMESNAMLSDDIYAGAKPAAERVGLHPYYDAGWFPIMSAYVRRFSTFGNIPPAQKLEMLELALDEQIDNVRRQKAPKKRAR